LKFKVLGYSAEATIMDKTLTPDLSPDESADIKSAIENIFAQIARSIEQMRKDQAEIDRLKAETRAMLEKLKAA